MVQERRSPTTEQVQEMLPAIKSGTVTTDGNGVASITFATAFPDANYAISLICKGNGSTIAATYSNKTVAGFSLKAKKLITEEHLGGNAANAVIDWRVTPYSNP